MLSRIWSSQKLPKERMTSRDATGLPNERRLGCLKVYKMTIYESQKKKFWQPRKRGQTTLW